MKFFSPVVSGSESYYDELSNYDWYYQIEKDEYDFTSRFVNIDDKILEVGCGEGVFSRKIISKSYTGLEFSRNAIKKASGQNIKVLNESIEYHSRNNSGIYDVVCTFQVLEHIPNVKQFLKACIKCLREKGLLIISVPNDDSYIGKIKNDILNLPPHHVSRWNEKVFRKIPELLNVELEKIHKEKVRDEHIKAFKETTLLEKIYTKPGLIDISFEYRTKRKIVSYLPDLFFSKAERNLPESDGHSITAVFRKC